MPALPLVRTFCNTPAKPSFTEGVTVNSCRLVVHFAGHSRRFVIRNYNELNVSQWNFNNLAGSIVMLEAYQEGGTTLELRLSTDVEQASVNGHISRQG